MPIPRALEIAQPAGEVMPQNFGVRLVAWFGELGLFAGRVFHAIFTRPFEGEEFLRQLDSIGSKSLPLVALAGAATGVVLSMQTRESLIQFGAKSVLPAVIVYSIIRETGPIITALIVSGRVGAGSFTMKAWCSSMRPYCPALWV